MGRGEYYEVRLGKPLALADLRSEWFEWFLTGVDQYRPKQGSVALWALGGAGFILKTPTATIYIDPYVGGSVESEGVILHRMIPIPLNASSVRRIDATVITHEDLDHLDENFIFPVNKNTKCQFIGPPSVADLLKSWEIAEERIVSLKENETTIIKDTKIVALPLTRSTGADSLPSILDPVIQSMLSCMHSDSRFALSRDCDKCWQIENPFLFRMKGELVPRILDSIAAVQKCET